MTDTMTTDAAASVATRPWLDAAAPVEERVALLLEAMTLEEKAGLFFHTMITIGDVDEGDPAFATPSAREYIEGRMMTLPVFIFTQYAQSTEKGYSYAWGGALVLIAIVMLLNLVARIIGAIFAPKKG